MWTIILVLIGVGILMVLLEILVIPGGGLAGLLGFGLMVTAVWLAFSREGNMAGLITLTATIIVNVGVLVYALRSKTWDKAMLKTNIDGKVNLVDENLVKAGDTGRTISRCAPGGKAIINNEFFEVHARSEFIDEDTEIEVIKLEGNKIFIKSKQ
ncbi:MAG: NfeD family protein [Bacteroidales bacterium]|nr:NfeD family protein [Bacteroidales bacterium]